MKKRKSKLERLTQKQIEKITEHSERRRNVPLIKSTQVNMRMNQDVLEKAKKLAEAQGIPYTTFLTHLLVEDIARLWKVFNKTG
jgi:predicted DNA binding CopG/RHH family protein